MTFRYTNQKIEAALLLLHEFKASNFPHRDSKLAVEQLISILEDVAVAQYEPHSSRALAVQTEMEATAVISEILELLGVIANSANVRNSFEIHGPVLDLAKKLLGDQKANLVISFEWNYIPYTYPQNHPDLPSFVIIGLPASEASNALVLPAIGHELGHSLWRRNKCRDFFEALINQQIIGAIKSAKFRKRYKKIFGPIKANKCDDYRNVWTWAEAADNCRRQVEEIFSDFTGLSLFGSSYLDSFEYLLSPALSTERSADYPPVKARAAYLEKSGATLGVSVRPNFDASFASQANPFHGLSNSHFQMELADFASNNLVPSIATHVKSAFIARSIRPPSDKETSAIVLNFKDGVPAENTTGIGAIINAGWSVFRDQTFMPKNTDPERMKTINELVLKSVEVFEIERMTRRDTKTKLAKKRTRRSR